MHYLVIDPDQMLLMHHQRLGEDILTRVLLEGKIFLDPPEIEVKLDELYGIGAPG
ncbi:MAG TPA: hypothetical protein VK446_01145 [Methylocystis sp.]|nr:hypothetical protein [Methylocystis sp.]